MRDSDEVHAVISVATSLVAGGTTKSSEMRGWVTASGDIRETVTRREASLARGVLPEDKALAKLGRWRSSENEVA
jgi:hypothetical protein